MSIPSLKPIACAVALALVPCLVMAQAPAAKADAANAANAANAKELAVARAELERAAKRVAELSHANAHADARAMVEQRMRRKPMVGVVLAPDAQAGVKIAGVTPQGPAAKGGLKSGDRLVSINGAPILGQEPRQRVENARKLLANVDVRTAVKLGYARDGRNAVVSVVPKLDQHVFVWSGDEGAFKLDFDDEDFARAMPAGVAPQIRSEIIRIGPDGKCKGADCSFRALSEAFRWNGLNLATVDPQLGRYFGTDAGVLVLSAGEDLAGLQAGDVIRKVDGKSVSSPREAMAALRARPADSKVSVEYLRDRKSATAQVKVPKAMPFRVPVPPTPPAPPAPPTPPSRPRPPTPPAPPAPPKSAMAQPAPVAPRVAMLRNVAVVDADGMTHAWVHDVDDATAPLPSVPPTPPVAPPPPVAPVLIN